ncbi:MAG: creatininase family protein [Victivallales bacterium]|nr:creatininase family protein [Victivallales bacterium]
MKYLHMRAGQIREAIEKRYPLVLPLGVIEYHGEHLPIGTDCFVAEQAIGIVEERHQNEMVVMPTFYYGTATKAVAAPENNGTVSISPEKLIPVAEEIFRGLLAVGFRNIHCFIAHQTEEFEQGMPTDLAFRFAGRKVIFEFLDQQSGQGWWGKEENAKYYTGGENPFNYIRVHPVRTRESTKKRFKGDHAGILETSEMLAAYPQDVDMSKLDGSLWFTRTAVNATAEFGDAALHTTAEDIEILLFGENK